MILLAARAAPDRIAKTQYWRGSNASDSHSMTEAPIEAAQPVETVVIEASDDVTRVLTEIAAGRVRGTVAEIRKYLGCSQARAAAIRKQLA